MSASTVANMSGDRLVQSDEAELGQCTLAGTRYGDLNQDHTVITCSCCLSQILRVQLDALGLTAVHALPGGAQVLQQLPAPSGGHNGTCGWAAAVLDGAPMSWFED